MHLSDLFSLNNTIRSLIVTAIFISALFYSIFLFANPVKACSEVATFEEDYSTVKTIFSQGEMLYIMGSSSGIGHYKIRIVDPMGNITYYSHPVYDKVIKISWTLNEDAMIGNWKVQMGVFVQGKWNWNKTANFSVKFAKKYQLKINIKNTGSVVKDPDKEFFIYGEIVILTAFGDTNWGFDAWSGDISEYKNPISVNITRNMTITASFKLKNINNAGGGGGSTPKIKSGPNGEKGNLPPIADLSAGATNQEFAGTKITFNGSLSYDPDGFLVSWIWDFGDGIKEEGKIASHVFLYEGKYKLTLTVIDNNDIKNSTEVFITIVNNQTISSDLQQNNPVKEEIDKQESGWEIFIFYIITISILGPLVPFIILSKLKKLKKTN